MAEKPPKSHLSSTRSTFALIDPSTSLFHRQIDRHAYLTSGFRTHVAISYVWSEWRNNALDKLPSWAALQKRLASLLGERASPGMKAITGKATRCWLDCMCIDQESSEDKSYWIPRMDEIYYEARCTILLLRVPGLDLGPVLQVKRRMHCPLSGPLRLRDIAQMVPHNCLLCQSCTSLSELDSELETSALGALKILCDATWRERAWILQEILLSQNYLLTWDDSGEWLSLADTAVIAALLYRRNLEETWLDGFASWCRRLWYLRQNYDEAQTYELCDANVLQLASTLSATVPSDKYYALCGMLRLKHIKPNPEHNANEALVVIVDALVQEGRMSWLYAVPPSLESSMQLQDGEMAPFVLTRLEDSLKPNKKHRAAIQSEELTLDAIQLGRITQVLPLSQVLESTFTHLRETRDFDFPESMAYCHRVPDIIRRLSLDLVDPLLLEPTFGHICRALQPFHTVKSEARKGWLCVMFLSFMDEPLIQEMCEGAAEEDVQIVRSAAASLQRHLMKIRGFFSVLLWTKKAEGDKSVVVSVAVSGCPVDAHIFSLNGELDSMFAARLLDQANAYDEFCGPLLSLNVRDTIGPRPSRLFTTQFWRKQSSTPHVKSLRFRYRGGDEVS
ncbi:hypothetical protein BKA58DRAFT_186560 [Alternaria rosae]|uniref:uncharacterized protein n=1 Tax=Alternaria rosae TaxID=1187941 RepID=UPI001E8DFD0A|nr:uncharacterized protein BKA58DRAFT_186560 [Alternaria rosae]KAH6867981.1 hypothetical protein BKA58DRAFT_186560 [Alternaria rosae]